MIHVVFSRLDYALEIAGRSGLRVPALSAAGGSLPAGHYRVVRFVPHRPWSVTEGPGKIELAELGEADVGVLIDAGRARRREHDARLEIDGIAAVVARLAGGAEAFVCGGGDGADATAPFQRLLPPPPGGVRVHNADLARVADVVFGASAAVRIVVFTVVGEA